MNSLKKKSPFVAIACGGTGGHLFPGIAVAEELKKRGCKIALLISPKDVDQQAVKSAQGFEIFTFPAVGLQNRNYFSFAKSFWNSFRASRKIFKTQTPDAVLAMGGFTSAPPVLAARKLGAKTFLHESNTIPGRANRFLSRFVDEAFVGFPEAAARLRAKNLLARPGMVFDSCRKVFAANFLAARIGGALVNPPIAKTASGFRILKMFREAQNDFQKLRANEK